MKDPHNENPAETPGHKEAAHGAKAEQNEQSAPKPAFRSAPLPPKKPEAKPVPSFEELAEAKPSKPPVAPTRPKAPAKPTPSFEELAESAPAKAAVTPKPAAAPMPTPAKVAITQKPATAKSAPTPDPSISIDPDSGPNVALLVVDALAAAIAIAFTVLLVQDTLPFLK